ncbi:MAG: tryptophan--tRNA ligase [Myxococcota bacterium]
MKQENAKKKRILSGMRPTGKLHIGHLHGALENWVRLQDEYECFYCVVDWHALTTEYKNPELVASATLEVAIDYLAAGIDPSRSNIFVQSAVKQHSELFLLLAMITPLGWLERLPSYKEQLRELREKEINTFGFLGYPLLQVADIVIYKADAVPVGEDQVAHIEFARELVRRFHFIFGKEVFPEPKELLTHVPRLPGLDGRKMSKSYGNAIELGEEWESVEKKILTAKTDPARIKRSDPGNPDICLIYDYHKVYSGDDEIEYVNKNCRTAGIGCIECKKILLKNMKLRLEPIRERRRHYESHRGEVEEILNAGSKRARGIAEETLKEVREVLKLDRY